jgi:pyridoxamine 5'-phosphate oxidase
MVLDLRMYNGDFETGSMYIKNFKDCPLKHLHEWLIEASVNGERFPNAMTLTTSGEKGISMRTVFLKHFKNEKLRFFSSYKSRKALELKQNNNLGVHFFFKKMRRQIFIRGTVEKAPISESEDYFNSQKEEHQLMIWAAKSDSEIFENNDELSNKVSHFRNKFEDMPVPCPDFWGGYDITPKYIEFWEGVDGVLHQRIIYELINGQWIKKRIAP